MGLILPSICHWVQINHNLFSDRNYFSWFCMFPRVSLIWWIMGSTSLVWIDPQESSSADVCIGNEILSVLPRNSKQTKHTQRKTVPRRQLSRVCTQVQVYVAIWIISKFWYGIGLSRACASPVSLELEYRAQYFYASESGSIILICSFSLIAYSLVLSQYGQSVTKIKS